MASDPMELTIEPIVDLTMQLVEFKTGSHNDGSLSSSSAAPQPKRSCLKNKSTDPDQKYTGSDSPGYFFQGSLEQELGYLQKYFRKCRHIAQMVAYIDRVRAEDADAELARTDQSNGKDTDVPTGNHIITKPTVHFSEPLEMTYYCFEPEEAMTEYPGYVTSNRRAWAEVSFEPGNEIKLDRFRMWYRCRRRRNGMFYYG
ncbi:hypothetical protein BDP81DRAFT_395908 [Colletotrichum phormii]|uniref:Uncharacterized protein n=1 Tax=Colletotrichum phormii TaxID=359342 RepID=A0AAJ0ED31_9PEZI|nr:uncharacterized protein BDP81DRAFT_395908 [Colletotrichum phormii]KAK1634629.1 hypothetical protein BDP81DRAFT_395908 [Colletotrichum phormii]